MKTKTLLFILFWGFHLLNFAQKPGEIIFSSSPIDPLNPVSLKTNFAAGEHIYAVAYLPQIITAYYSNDTPEKKVNIEVFIYSVKPPLYSYQKEDREEQLTYVNLIVSGSIKANKYLMIDIVPDPETTEAYTNPEISYKKFGNKYDGPVNFAETLAQLEPGENNLKVVVNCYYNLAAKGNLNISGDDFEAYSLLAQQLNSAAANAGAKSARLPKAEKSDPALESRMIAALKNSNDWKNGRLDATEVLRTAIYDKDWYIRRHEISGAILHRYIRAAIAVKGKGGQCAYYIVTFQEDYVGGKFQPLKYDGAGDRYAINCENLGK
ncbi:MAG: hypothetical protein K0B15_12050 [Lentimicrobium sp.]|nr:hypothetical protein [Lentimicrobium sp.]